MTVAKNADHALVKTARLNGLVKVFEHDALVDAAVLQAASRAQELLTFAAGSKLMAMTDAELAAQDPPWTRRQLNVAIHALMPRKDAPIYVQFAQERQIQRMRTLPSGGGGEDTAHGFVIPVTEARPPEADEDDEGDEP